MSSISDERCIDQVVKFSKAVASKLSDKKALIQIWSKKKDNRTSE
jgi:hypothetical protein